MNEQAYLTIEEIISVPALSGATISEDGKRLAFTKKTADWKDNTYKNHVWIYEKDAVPCSPLTTNSESTSPLWSPASREIAYLSPAGEGDQKDQIFVQSLDGDKEVQITDEAAGVSNFQWDPAGTGFYYLAQVKKSEARKKRREVYGDFQHIGKEYRNNCLYYRERKTTDASSSNGSSLAFALTDGKDFHIHEFDLSQDGKKLVFLAAPSPAAEDLQNGDLYIFDIGTGELQKLHINKLLGGSVCFAPGGNKICYQASIREKNYYRNRIQDSTLEIYDLDTGEFTQPLPDIDSTVVPLRWTAKGILIQWQHHTAYLIGLLAEDGAIEMLSETADGFTLEASITRDGHHLACTKAYANETFDIYLDGEKITNANQFFKDKLQSKREIISWHTSDGHEIEGVLSTPAAFDPNKRYPLLVVVHGGPAWASFPIFSDCFNEKYPIEAFIEKGFIVLEPNYRGSSGYGNDFLKANYRKLGIAYYEDVIAGVDLLIEQGMADKDRVGVMGWSNGGYVSAFCSTFSNRFKAISVGGGITNWITHYATTDIPNLMRMHLGNPPSHDPEIYAKTSPMSYIQSACTPTLIQHGEMDARVPVPNAYELHRGLQDMEVDTEFILFKGMAYSPEQPGMTAAIMKQNLLWFSHYILGESMEGFRVL